MVEGQSNPPPASKGSANNGKKQKQRYHSKSASSAVNNGSLPFDGAEDADLLGEQTKENGNGDQQIGGKRKSKRRSKQRWQQKPQPYGRRWTSGRSIRRDVARVMDDLLFKVASAVDGRDAAEKEKFDSAAKKRRMLPWERANYFIAVQVTSAAIKESLQAVQQSLVSREPLLKNSMIPLESFHFTLMVMILSEEHCLHDAKKSLHESVERVRQLQLPSLELEVEGLDNFKNSVIYAKVKPGEAFDALARIAKIIRSAFEANGILAHDDDDEFSPHLTIAKVSKDKGAHRKGIRVIPQEYYAADKLKNFGVQAVESIQLLSMKKDPASGYYFCIEELPLFK